MDGFSVTPEEIARPGERIGWIEVHERRTNHDARTIFKYIAKLGEPRDAMLCLQGGALRAIYSAGVTDVMLDAGISFKDVVGVSAGSIMGLDYVAGLRGAAAYTNLVYAGDSRYMGLRDLILKHQVFDFGFMFDEIGVNLLPFDYKRFFSSPMTLTVVATNCVTGEPTYVRSDEVGEDPSVLTTAISASSSMPLLSKPIVIDGVPHLDGGSVDPLGLGPAREAIAQGRKVVIVTTRERGFAYPPLKARTERMYRRFYKRYPAFVEKVCHDNELINEQLDEADQLAAEGKAFVLHPIKPPQIGRTETSTAKLRALYEQGVYETVAQLPALKAYLDS